jgi:hypothetical protein
MSLRGRGRLQRLAGDGAPLVASLAGGGRGRASLALVPVRPFESSTPLAAPACAGARTRDPQLSTADGLGTEAGRRRDRLCALDPLESAPPGGDLAAGAGGQNEARRCHTGSTTTTGTSRTARSEVEPRSAAFTTSVRRTPSQPTASARLNDRRSRARRAGRRRSRALLRSAPRGRRRDDGTALRVRQLRRDRVRRLHRAPGPSELPRANSATVAY